MSATDGLSPRQVADRLGTSTRTVQRWIASGRLPASRLGGRWRVAFGAFDAFQRPADESPPDSPPDVSPIRALFIANRGEIATRISRTCDRLGIRTIIPGQGGQAPLDLLDGAAIVAAARISGADAVHPGFGFLSEQADFAQQVVDSGLRWVGPPPAAIRTMGDKAAARRLAASLGIPVIPGYDDPDQSDAALERAAAAIGAPLLVKPAAGGGGKGMRVVAILGQLPDALAAARREALAAFGDDRLVLERLLEGPRHVEVQVLFDAHGRGIHLGERDCSLQRRHQKVLEESPSPTLNKHLRSQLTDAALRLAQAVGYVNAGTCEFLLDNDGRYWFLEMNTRLQVEHPVTELVTGRDLVADQLWIAAGGPLSIDQAAADAARATGGHAIEVRLYAEDAEAGFLPATGRVEALRWPTTAHAPGTRVDAGIELGTQVGDRFDPLLAKVIVGGRGRAEALQRLAAALDDTLVLGLTTNLRFLRWLVRQPVVVEGQIRIDTLDEIWPPDDSTAQFQASAEVWTAAARLLAATTESGGWRLNGTARLRLATDDGTERLVDLPREPSASAPDGVLAGTVAHVDVAGRSVPFRLAPAPDVDRAIRSAGVHSGGPSEVLAPMPGTVRAVHVQVGSTVTAGQPIVALEAMKMEHVVTARAAGTVLEVLVRAGDQVRRGELLASIG